MGGVYELIKVLGFIQDPGHQIGDCYWLQIIEHFSSDTDPLVSWIIKTYMVKSNNYYPLLFYY